MKIFISGTSFDPSYGGPAVSVSRLATALAVKGVEVILWAPDGSATSSPLVRTVPGLTPRSGTLKKAMDDLLPSLDLIHDNGVWLPHNHAIAGYANRYGLPRVVTLRGMLEPWAFAYRPLKKKVAWALYQRRDLETATVLHATADSEALSARGLSLSNRIEVIPNGVDLPATCSETGLYDKLRTSSLSRALFLGRIHPKKGIPLLLDAWARVRPAGWELLVVGPAENGHDEEIRQQSLRLGIGNDVTIRGPLYGAEKESLYHSANLFILPTYSENFGISVAEALAHEIPVLTTTGAPWSLLETERCGWWVPPTPEGIVSGLNSAVSMSLVELREMGLRGRIIMKERFAWDTIAEAAIAQIYLPIISSSKRRLSV